MNVVQSSISKFVGYSSGWLFERRAREEIADVKVLERRREFSMEWRSKNDSVRRSYTYMSTHRKP